jgi:hypothetical protein
MYQLWLVSSRTCRMPARAAFAWLLVLALTTSGAWPAASADKPQNGFQTDEQACAQPLPPQPAADLESGRAASGGTLALGACGAGYADARLRFSLHASNRGLTLGSSGRGARRSLQTQHVRLQI